MKYAVIAFAKCGTVSTDKWLNSQGHDSVKLEWPYLLSHEKIKKILGDRTPVLVTRDKPDALWSFYEYFGYKMNNVPFEAFLHINIRFNRFKNFTPLEIYDYDRWIEHLKPFNPVIYKLEELQKLDDYPHKNRTVKKSIIPDKHRKYLNSIGVF